MQKQSKNKSYIEKEKKKPNKGNHFSGITNRKLERGLNFSNDLFNSLHKGTTSQVGD